MINTNYIIEIEQKIINLEQSKGSIILIEGDIGSGKSFLINQLFEKFNKSFSSINFAKASCQAPIGHFNVSNLQALKVFELLLEYLLNPDKNISAEKKFALNAGLTLLTAIPIAGEVFYAAKELSRDWRQFKKDKQFDKNQTSTSVLDDFNESFQSLISKAPLCLIIDDAQWIDNTSIELLQLLDKNIAEQKLVIILAYRNTIKDPQYTKINSYIDVVKKLESTHTIEILPLEKQQISAFIKQEIKSYKTDNLLENLLFEKSGGNPGILAEYCRYFIKTNAFDNNGNLVIDINDHDFMPTSLATVFAKEIENLSDEEKNLLAVCSSEGREFSAFMIAKLSNQDVLTTIKKLRAISLKSNIIKSLGPHWRYGVKTTLYQFTQTFYYKYFESTLEFEEYQSLHGEISAVLQEQYNNSELEDVKNEIAPYLAAHSSESGDKSTLEKMLVLSAAIAQKYHPNQENNSKDATVSNSNDNELKIANQIDNEGQTTFLGDASVTIGGGYEYNPIAGSFFDIAGFRAFAFQKFKEGKFDELAAHSVKIWDSQAEKLNLNQKIQVLTFSARAFVELKEYNQAEEKLKKAKNLLNGISSPQAECLMLNTYANYYFSKNEYVKASRYLTQAASLAIQLPMELRMVTISNIAHLFEQTNPEKALKYKESAEKMSRVLGLNIN